MNTKLTLNVDRRVIEKAKEYSKSRKISLSRLVESYLSSLTANNKQDIEITPIVESLGGVIKLDKDFDYKEVYTDYLTKKYK